MFDNKQSDDLEISTESVRSLIESGAPDLMLVDVREAWELTRGVLPGAIHRPLSRFTDFKNQWPDDKSLIIYCEHGVRSLDVAMWLLRAKSIRSKSMHGGFAEWHGPTVKPDVGETL